MPKPHRVTVEVAPIMHAPEDNDDTEPERDSGDYEKRPEGLLSELLATWTPKLPAQLGDRWEFDMDDRSHVDSTLRAISQRHPTAIAAFFFRSKSAEDVEAQAETCATGTEEPAEAGTPDVDGEALRLLRRAHADLATEVAAVRLLEQLVCEQSSANESRRVDLAQRTRDLFGGAR